MTGRLRRACAFGPVDGKKSTASLDAHWCESDSDLERVVAAVELGKRGNFTRREEWAALMLRGVDDPGLAQDLQHLVITTATAALATDPRLATYACELDGDLQLAFAASGSSLLASAATPIYLDIARLLVEQGLDYPNDWLFAATDSVTVLAGVRVDLENLDDVEFFDLSVVLDDLRGRALGILSQVSAHYVRSGSPVHPWALLEKVRESAALSRRSGHPFRGTQLLDLLSTWSGVMCPEDIGCEPLGVSQVRAIGEWLTLLDGLAWRPGVKFFYGHDVDGGPGLGGPTADQAG